MTHRYTLTNICDSYTTSILLGSGGLYFGYYHGIFNPLFEPLMTGVYGYDKERDKSTIDIYHGMINMLYAVGAMVGVLGTGALADRFGRRHILYMGEIIAILCVVPYACRSIVCLMIARLISGVVAGINSAIFSIMLIESLPNSISGFGNGFAYLMVSFSIFISFICQNIFDRNYLIDHWRIILLWPCIISVLRLILFSFYIKSDTPKYIYNSEKDGEVARNKIRHIYRRMYIEDDAIKATNDSIKCYEEENKDGVVTLKSVFGRKYRKRLISGCFVAFAGQLSGINFFIFYSTKVFDQIKEGYGKKMTPVIGLNNIIGSIMVLYLISKMGRKFNLVMGALCQAVGMSILYVGYKMMNMYVLILSTCVYMIAFAIGLGGTETAYIGEILPPVGVGVALAVQWIMTAVIGQVTAPLIDIIGPDMLIIIFAVLCFIFTLCLDYLTIETNNKSEKEIIEEFESGRYKFMDIR